MATIFPTTPIFLTSGSSFNDYRPTMDPSGTTVIFERTPTRDDGGPTTLQMMDVSNPNPSPFLSGSAPASQTRPDWCWATGKSNVLFNGASSNNSKKSPVSVYMVGVVGSTGANPTLISGTTGAYYPKWNLEGTLFVTENDRGTPSPCNTIFTLGGVAQTANIDGVDMNNVSIFGGMPAVMSTDLPQIAYAGQPRLANWNGPNTPIKYSENYNYIFLNTPKRHQLRQLSAGIGRLDLVLRSAVRGPRSRHFSRRHDDRLRVQSPERCRQLLDLPVQPKEQLGHAGDRVHSELPARQVLSLRHQADPRRPESDLEHWLGGHLEPAVIRGDGLTLP